jgi:hypothetical protein
MFKSYAYSMQRNNEDSSSNRGFWSWLFALLFGRTSAA